MGASQRRKGADGEREAVKLLRRYGLQAKRTAPIQAAAKALGEHAPDMADVDIKGSPFWIEVKRGKQVGIRAAIRQARADCPGHMVPVVLFRDDRGEWMFAAPAEEILDAVLEVLERTEMMAPRRSGCPRCGSSGHGVNSCPEEVSDAQRDQG